MINPLCVCMNVMCSQLGRCLKESTSVTPTTNSNTILPELEQLKREYFEGGFNGALKAVKRWGDAQAPFDFDKQFEDYEAQRLLSKKEIEK